MTTHANILKGTIHGRTIELDREPGLPDGQAVTVTLQPAPLPRPQPGTLPEGLLRAFGAWADDDPEGLDEYLKTLRHGASRDSGV